MPTTRKRNQKMSNDTDLTPTETLTETPTRKPRGRRPNDPTKIYDITARKWVYGGRGRGA